jgi:hypothetical protein
LRVVKCFVLALLMTPSLMVELRRRDGRAPTPCDRTRGRRRGVVIAFMGTPEAFPGILDFSSDYRTTGLF